MSFYTFRLIQLHVKRHRGKIPDTDLVTFSVFVNQVERGRGAGWFPAVRSGGVYSTDDRTEHGLLAFPAEQRLNMTQQWEIGPLEILPSDNVQAVYTGTNTSDSQLSSLDTKQQDEIQLKVMNTILSAVLKASLGVVGEAIDKALSALGDPIAAALGFEPQGPCNGTVFSDAVQFTGSDLDRRAWVASVPGSPAENRFTRSYTDAATHDTEICGEIALTDVTFSVRRWPFVSVKVWVQERFHRPHHHDVALSKGLRQLGKPGTTISIKSLLGVRP